MGYATEYLILASLRLRMCISPLMLCCILYHFLLACRASIRTRHIRISLQQPSSQPAKQPYRSNRRQLEPALEPLTMTSSIRRPYVAIMCKKIQWMWKCLSHTAEPLKWQILQLSYTLCMRLTPKRIVRFLPFYKANCQI